MIESSDNGKDAIYIDSIIMDGKKYTPSYFKIEDLQAGKHILISKSEIPDKKWGTDSKDYPYSFSKEQSINFEK